jgi:hypothetical protein
MPKLDIGHLLQVVPLQASDGSCSYDVFYAGKKVGVLLIGCPGTPEFDRIEAGVYGTDFKWITVGVFPVEPVDSYSAYYAARTAAAKECVVAYDKVIDGEVL